ncbi:MAG: nSTAND1 domain-containing NTPase [Armatimonadota bacterium]
MNVDEIVISPPDGVPENQKGDFFEDIMRSLMQAQRFKVIKRIRFTGTEIDLLCEHLDRPGDTMLLECKARKDIRSGDLKEFAYDVHDGGHAKLGYFVHTSDLHHEAAGIVDQWRKKDVNDLLVWGPSKVAELLADSGYVVQQPSIAESPGNLTVTKTILAITETGRYWVRLLARGTMPSHYVMHDATTGQQMDEKNCVRIAKYINDIGAQLKPLTPSSRASLPATAIPETVAEVQEAEQWDDYRPASSKYFVGRKDIRSELYHFILRVLSVTSNERAFYLEGKSGWGKSSIVADLRTRSRNTHNKKKMFVYAVDSRSAVSDAFPALAFARMIEEAVAASFLPDKFAGTVLQSPMTVLQSPGVREVLNWLTQNRRVMLLVFDQFEDIFRRAELFKCFHQLMMDVNATKAPFMVGFSWRSDINIPIDNPAYHLWQLSRDQARCFNVQEFGSSEVDGVIRQLETESHQRLPMDLRRRLVEISQGFPWLIKKLAIHCYRQFSRGVSPEQLVDQDLNAELLFKEDMEGLDQARMTALKYIAQRAYDGDAFDVTELDDRIPEDVVNSLLSNRLVIRSGSKYNVYWDIFQEYLVTGDVPKIGESFLVRQYPKPCIETLEAIFRLGGKASVETLATEADQLRSISESTIDNRLRELRHLGLLVKQEAIFTVRAGIQNMAEAREYIQRRLDAHVVVSDLRKSRSDVITHPLVRKALRHRYATYRFKDKTWGTYASYLMAWMRSTNIDLGGRLGLSIPDRQSPETFTPQLRAEKLIEGFEQLPFEAGPVARTRANYKLEYDLKNLGLVAYSDDTLILTLRGKLWRDLPPPAAMSGISEYACETLKIRRAAEIVMKKPQISRAQFAAEMSDLLSDIKSKIYRNKTITVLRSWSEFVHEHPIV